MKSEITKVRPSKLEAHTGRGKQRAEGVDERRAARMAANFKPHAVGVLTAVKRGGAYLVIDGAHRLKMFEILGIDDPIDVRVISDASDAEEAESFHDLNSFKSPSAVSKFISRVSAGDPVAVEVEQIITANGWVVSTTVGPGAIRCIDAAVKQVHSRGNLDRTLKLLTAAYGYDEDAVHQNMFVGVSTLLFRLGDVVDDAQIIATLKANAPSTVLRKARSIVETQGGTAPAAVARVLVGLHNKGRRTRLLPEWVWTR